jgi:hypothetical protein
VSRLDRRTRRRIERDLRKIMKADDEHCTLCRRPFAHGDLTYGGATATGAAAVTGDCCAAQMAHKVTGGVFLDLAGAYGAIAADMAKRAGVWGAPIALTTADTSWKRDDAAWFKANPHRSHRLRPMFPGEAPTLMREPAALPPRHEHQVLVRQVEPGQRVRLVFGRNLDCPIPDAEAVLHALFDLAARGEAGKTASVAEVAELALRYAAAPGQEAH